MIVLSIYGKGLFMDERELRRRKAAKRRRAIRKRRILVGSMLGILLILIILIACILKSCGNNSTADALTDIEQQLSEEQKSPEIEHTVSEAVITFAGDVCFHEDGYVMDYYDTVNDLEKCISPEILQIMKESDVFCLNHEYTIGESGTATTAKRYTFQAKPERMDLLTEMGVDLVTLANNHVYDYGPDALHETCDLLDKANIDYIGGGHDIEDAKRAAYYEINGLKIGIVAASNAEVHRYTPQATESSPGILLAYDMTEYLEVVREASQNCDYLIAYMHWGTESSNYLNEQQQSEGRQLLEAGADIVVGGHPHVLQGMEFVDGKPLVYSLGDFWFNKETKPTGLLQLRIDQNGLKEMSFVPCMQTEYRVEYLNESNEQENLYQFLEDLSININIDPTGIISPKTD